MSVHATWDRSCSAPSQLNLRGGFSRHGNARSWGSTHLTFVTIDELADPLRRVLGEAIGSYADAGKPIEEEVAGSDRSPRPVSTQLRVVDAPVTGRLRVHHGPTAVLGDRRCSTGIGNLAEIETELGVPEIDAAGQGKHLGHACTARTPGYLA